MARNKWDSETTEEISHEYKEMQHKAKREVEKATQKVYDELNERLETNIGQKALCHQRD